MKAKLAFLTLIVLGISVAPAAAEMFTLNHDSALMLWQVYSNPETPLTYLMDLNSDGVWGTDVDSPSTYGGSSPMGGQVGFVGQIFDSGNVYSPFAQIGIGANFWGTSSTGSGATTADVIGAALGSAPTNSLLGYEGYELAIFNDNNSTWWVNIFMNTGYTGQGEEDVFFESGWVAVDPGDSVTLTLDFADVANLDHVTNIGFQIGGRMAGGESLDPSNPDTFHLSIVPVPGAVLLGLLGLGVAGRKLRKRA